MKIRNQQMREHANERHVQFEQRMADHIRAHRIREYEQQGLLRGDLLNFVREQIARGRKYGFINAADLKLYIDCAAVWGRDFDRDPMRPWAKDILERSDLDGRGKADMLQDRLTFTS